ncbi:hypothetical protein EDD18DRAFT_1363164 [Armillaria luteobubalina]|uniref:Uncharacterized protein n=1 Tax=Armillaria luteobubalina TaxID=153913 RepID=A0AA39U9K5_9AGAR|nr:hypothetical protein EDD18DRAFT_1363164 [Armillaria luteobubalina]
MSAKHSTEVSTRLTTLSPCTMWARIFSFGLLLFVACTTAESPVNSGHWHGCTIQGAFDAMGVTFYAIQGALSAFSTNVDVHHAMVIKDDIHILGKQMKDAVACIPVCSIAAINVCNAEGDIKNPPRWKMETLIALKDDFQSTSLTAEIGLLLKKLVSDSDEFDRKFLAAVPPSARIRTDQYYTKMGEQLQQAFGTFC